MKRDDMMTWLILGGGVALAYWYITNYGPSGTVTNAQGVKVAPSYWDQWFGGASAVAAAPAPPVTTTPAVNPPPSTTVLPPVTPSAPSTQIPNLCSPMIAAASTNNQMQKDTAGNIIGTISQWNWFAHSLIPPNLPDPSIDAQLVATKMGQAVVAAGGDQNGLFTCQQWFTLYTSVLHQMGLAGLNGLGAQVTVPTRPRSMSFGGSFGGGYGRNPQRTGIPTNRGWVQ